MPADDDETRRVPGPRGGRWLALVPATIGIVMMVLMMPRAAAPSSVPVPEVDERALTQAMRSDDERAAKAKATRLPTDVLAIGTAVRAIQSARQKEELLAIDVARAMLEDARRALGQRSDWEEDLLTLRAVQTASFLEELARHEATGEITKDLEELGGVAFLRRMSLAGWTEGRRVILSEAARRVAFKTMWNSVVGVEALAPFQPTLDEQRALYAVYLAHPSAGELELRTLESMRRAATTPEACARAAAEDRRIREAWRAEKIRRLGEIDPSYPTAYALGVSYHLGGRYDLASDSFRSWLDMHPDGPWSLRARNHLKASLAGDGP